MLSSQLFQIWLGIVLQLVRCSLGAKTTSRNSLCSWYCKYSWFKDRRDKLVVCKQGLHTSGCPRQEVHVHAVSKIKCSCTLDSLLHTVILHLLLRTGIPATTGHVCGSSDSLSAEGWKFQSSSNLWNGGSDCVMITSCRYGAKSLRGMLPARCEISAMKN